MTGQREIIIRLPEQVNKDSLLAAFARTCDFNTEFGYNWDALWDALNDWLEAQRLPLTLVLEQSSVIHSEQQDWAICLEIMEELQQQWPGFEFLVRS